MSRTDTYLDGLLRHLGAEYYKSLQGRATQDEVTEAVETVTRHLNGHGDDAAGCVPPPAHESRLSRLRGFLGRPADSQPGAIRPDPDSVPGHGTLL